jgi:type II secretory pathway component PulF
VGTLLVRLLRIRAFLKAHEGYQSKKMNALQAGYIKILNLILGGIIAVLGLLILFVYVLPQVYTQADGLSGNLTASGAPADAAKWWVWIFWFVVVLVIIGVVAAMIKNKGVKF